MSSKEWKKYEAFANKAQDADKDELTELMDETFPDISSKSLPKRFQFCVIRMWKSKTTDEIGLRVLPMLYKVYERLYPKLTTRRQSLSTIRQIIKEHQSANLYKKSQLDEYFNLEMNERVELVEAYREDVIAKNTKKYKVDIVNVFDRMRTLILDKNPYNRGIALMLSSGMRPIELFYRNTVSPVDDEEKKDTWIRVDDLAKKREGQKSFTERPIVMFSVKTFMAELKRFRKHFAGKAVKVVDVQTGKDKLSTDKSQTMNLYAIKQFPFLQDFHQKASMLRKLYADISYTEFADTSSYNMNTWVSKVLGHDSVLTSFSYSWIHAENPDAIKSEDLLNSKIDMLTEQIKMLMGQDDKKYTKEEEKQDYKTPVHTPKPRESDESKMERLEKIWAVNPKISNSALRAKAKLGSSIVNKFMQSKKEEKETS